MFHDPSYLQDYVMDNSLWICFFCVFGDYMYSYLQSNIIQYPDAPVQLMFGGTGPFLGFWCDFDGVLMGLNGNQLVLVTAMFGGTDPFLGFWWCF